ncbi:MAG: NAD(P)/FAD-dependent oxidoreductase [Fibrobacter sp.]|uniref:NAD(P)/FAD-dependent oxidoreductase n=1 Tax=Fibrobacter sp. TaxID=35828 RepID=UPI001B154948|nr:NAD(P)/FAD-dependent oxidoreductase [Fibrobacter sp.]MBO7060885.1 NAD(P)/FAD-dependent oxidoreductase [Fibrobacter sp.]MBO7104660.1 NAD(P)/FAD-dependent oxidoreductase [Fibrobacter sp.]
MADILILGYGPAGISAALYGLRAGLDVLIVGKDVGALARAHMIENYYGLEKPLSGPELAEVGKKQALALGAKIVDDEVTDLFFDGNDFVAGGLSGEYRGKACIMATGSARKKQPLPGMAELEGHGVSYCAVCDAFFYRQKKVAVLGSGEYALHEVSELLPMASSVTLLTNGSETTATFPETVTVETRKLAGLVGEGAFKGVRFEDGSEESFDGLFVALGSASATDLARKAGAAFEGANPVLGPDFQTTVPGLFAAGDCTGGTLQVAVAVGEGAVAGLAAIKYLREKRNASA